MEISFPNLFDLKVQVNRKTRRAIRRYFGGMVLCAGKKNCSAMARDLDISHDVIHEFFDNTEETKRLLEDALQNICSKLPTNKGCWYINIDETLIEKIFAEKMEAVALNWSSSHDSTMRGHAIVAAVITNGKITIPITFKTWYSQKLFPDRHQTRIKLAQSLMIEIKARFPNLMFLLDGAFSSEDMLHFCQSNKIKFCMRFNSNKVVVIGNKIAQIRKQGIIKESGSRKQRAVRGHYKGIPVYFVACKQTDKKGKAKIVYLVTSEKQSPKKTIKTYRKRWNIEKFFRTAKQYLGMRDCQALSAAKQETHIFAVCVAYAWLQIQKFRLNAKNTEQILNKIRRKKSRDLIVKFETFCKEA